MTTDLCTSHHWLLPTTGAEVIGVCKLCGAESAPMRNVEDEMRGAKVTWRTHDPKQAAASAARRAERTAEAVRAALAARETVRYACKGCQQVAALAVGEYCETCRTEGIAWKCQGCGIEAKRKPRGAQRQYCDACRASRQRALEAARRERKREWTIRGTPRLTPEERRERARARQLKRWQNKRSG